MSLSHDATVLSNQLGESHRWHKDHFGSMLPDINGFSFRSSKGNDSSHVLVAFEVAKNTANSASSKKAGKLGTVKALEDNYKTEVRGVDAHHDWRVSGLRKCATNSNWQVDAIGRTAHVGVFTGAVGSPYIDRKNESDHVAGILAPNHSPNDVPSTWVMKQEERQKIARANKSKQEASKSTQWLSPKKPAAKKSVRQQQSTSPKVQSQWGVKGRKDLTQMKLSPERSFASLPTANKTNMTYEVSGKGVKGQKFIDKVEARYGDSVKNWDVPSFLRDSTVTHKKGYNLAMAMTQEKMHLQNIHRKERLESTKALNLWAKGQTAERQSMGF